MEGRRNINLAIIAMAQQLLVHFADHDVAGMAREAAVRGVTDVTYGDTSKCQAMGRLIEEVVRRLDGGDRFIGLVRQRAESLRLTAQYRRDNDTVPLAVSFAVVPVRVRGAGEAGPSDDQSLPVNVLADEYWDIYGVLLN
jgi:hypothetical protein